MSGKPRSTLNDHRPEPVICAEHGWGVGTLLVGDEGYGPTVIEITALGQGRMLAQAIAHNGVVDVDTELSWVLYCRDWREATAADLIAPLRSAHRHIGAWRHAARSLAAGADVGHVETRLKQSISTTEDTP